LSAAEKEGTIKLFNGKSLSNFYTYLSEFGKNNDPKKVFTVVDGAIRISGDGWGGLITEKEYGNYRLIAEFRWGQGTYGPREKAARDSGILIHCQGADGSFGKHWMPSIECQMIEGGTGDFLVLSTREHPFSLTVESELRPVTYRGKTADQLYFKPGVTPRSLSSGRVNWWGRDPNWGDVKGFRGKEDVERPVGQWNTLEVIADGDTLTNLLNGQVVNKGTKCSHTRGKLLIQSEGAEVFFRRVDLSPLSSGKRPRN
jgi:hypothetical protein